MENTEEIKSLLTSGNEVAFYSLDYPNDSTKGHVSKDLGLKKQALRDAALVKNFTDSQWDYFSTFQKACEKLKNNQRG